MLPSDGYRIEGKFRNIFLQRINETLDTSFNLIEVLSPET